VAGGPLSKDPKSMKGFWVAMKRRVTMQLLKGEGLSHRKRGRYLRGKKVRIKVGVKNGKQKTESRLERGHNPGSSFDWYNCRCTCTLIGSESRRVAHEQKEIGRWDKKLIPGPSTEMAILSTERRGETGGVKGLDGRLGDT